MTALLLGASISCSSPGPATSAAVVTVGTSLWPGSYWIDVAYDKGWFAEEGLDVRRVDTNGRYFDALDDVAAGRLDVMGFTQYDLLRHAAAGSDLVAVAAMDYSDGAEALIAQPGFPNLRSLRGKRIAVERGTYLEYLLSVATELEGLKLADFALENVTHEKALAMFKRHEIDAMFVWEPYGSEARRAGGVSLFSTADFPGLTYNVLAMRRDVAAGRKHDIEALLRVWHRAARFVREHPQETCDIVARLTGDPSGYARQLLTQDRVLDLTDNDRAFSYAAGFESLHGSWRRMNDFMLERRLVDRSVDSAGYLDADFIRGLH